MLPNKFRNKLPNLCPSVKGLGHKFGNLLLSTFTLATCAATNLRALVDSEDQRRPLANGTDVCTKMCRNMLLNLLLV